MGQNLTLKPKQVKQVSCSSYHFQQNIIIHIFFIQYIIRKSSGFKNFVKPNYENFSDKVC